MTQSTIPKSANSPLTVHFDNGESDQIFPNRAIAAVSTGEMQTAIWHLNPAGLVEQVTVCAEVKQVRAALGLPG